MAFGPVLAWHLVLHAGLGATLPEVVWLLCRATGPGEHQCLIFLLYPVAGGMFSWMFPLGAPAAGLMVALRSYLMPEVEGGPTAKALSEAFRVWIPASVLLPEIVVAVVQWARIQRGLKSNRNE